MDWIDALLIPAIKSLIVLILLLAASAYMTLTERKLVGRFVQRYGPNRAGPFGLFQPIADALKAFFKEEVIPTEVDKWIYIVCPGIALAASMVVFGVIPLGAGFTSGGREISMVVGDVNVGLLYVIAVAGLGLYGIILGGWSSNNNFSLLGALRSTAQIITYELPLGLALASLAVVAGSLRFGDIIDAQRVVPFIVMQPVGFLIYFISGMSEINRSPFDLPETENELVAGYSTEYGGIKFAIFYLAEYLNMVVMSVLIATLFLGGWRGPFAEISPILQVLWLGLKSAVVLFVIVWIRSSLPRVRYDKWMKFGWKFLFPLGLANLAVTAVVVALVA